ncbi:MAG: hypothetical protein Q7R92_04295 [bacterium]|nr:hypothetical protein [bacterium]
MKKIIFAFAFVLLLGFAQSSLAAPLSTVEQEQLTQFLKSKVNTVTLDFHPIVNGQDTWQPGLSFRIQKPNPIKTIELDAGKYNLYVFAGDNGETYFTSKVNPLVVEVLEGIKNKVKIQFVPYHALRVPVVIDAPRGEYEEGHYYEVRILGYGDESGNYYGFSENDYAFYQNGKLSFHVWAYSPYDTQSVLSARVTDKNGVENNMKFNFNIMDIVEDDFAPITLDPKTGELEIEVGYADEMASGLTVKPSPNTPAAKQIAAGTTMTATAEFTLMAVNADYRVREIELELPSTAAACSTNGAALFDNASEVLVGRSTFTGGMDMSTIAYATFSGLNFQIPKNSAKSLIAALNFVNWASIDITLQNRTDI